MIKNRQLLFKKKKFARYDRVLSVLMRSDCELFQKNVAKSLALFTQREYPFLSSAC